MSNEHVSRFCEMVLTDAMVGLVGDTVGDILRQGGGPGWVVLVEPGGDVAGVISEAELVVHASDMPARAALRTGRVVVVAHAQSSVVNGMATWAFEEARREPGQDVVVVVRDESRVWGVWQGPDLVEVLAMGVTRSGADTRLAGDVHIPELLRYCGYTSGEVTCGATLSFREFPNVMPGCPNPLKLADHLFVW